MTRDSGRSSRLSVWPRDAKLVLLRGHAGLRKGRTSRRYVKKPVHVTVNTMRYSLFSEQVVNWGLRLTKHERPSALGGSAEASLEGRGAGAGYHPGSDGFTEEGCSTPKRAKGRRQIALATTTLEALSSQGPDSGRRRCRAGVWPLTWSPLYGLWHIVMVVSRTRSDMMHSEYSTMERSGISAPSRVRLFALHRKNMPCDCDVILT